MSLDNPKNYQIWFHRQCVVERLGTNDAALEELDAIAKGYEEIRKMVDHQIVHKVTYR